MDKRPTIAELEKLLNSETDEQLEILPNGEIRQVGSTESIDTGTMKRVLTEKERLGGNY